MTKAQWKALYDFGREYGYSRFELLAALKENGTVDRHTTLEELGDYVNGNTYGAMRKFLEDNLL